MEPEPEPLLVKSRKRNHNFSKVGTGTVKNSYDFTTLTVHVVEYPGFYRRPPCLTPYSRVADPLHLNADPDLAFHFTADQDPIGHVYADQDHAPHESEANLRPLVYRPSRAPFLASPNFHFIYYFSRQVLPFIRNGRGFLD
jgi:hypothetical protein